MNFWFKSPGGYSASRSDPGAGPVASPVITPWSAVREYAVFARTAGAASADVVGYVVAPNDLIAKANARAAFDEERWIGLTVDCGHQTAAPLDDVKETGR